MLNAFLRGRSFLALSLVFFLLFSFSATYANEERDSGNLDAPLSLESDVALPEGLWPAGDNSAAEVPEEAPSMAVIPPPPLDPPPLKQLTLMLDWYLSPQHAALIVAKERALFAAQGLEIELLTPADPSIAIKLLAAGEVDLALSEAPAPAAVADALADLHYGYSTREGRDVLVEQLLPRSVRQVDDFVAPESVHFDAADALRSSRVDAVADGFFHTLPQQLASDGIVTHTVRYSDIDIPRHDGLILLANSDSVARQATTWSRVLIALEEASNWMIEHPEEAWTLLVTTHPVLDNPINQEAWDDLLRRVALSPAALDERRYAAFESYLQSAGVTENSIPITRLAANPHLLMER